MKVLFFRLFQQHHRCFYCSCDLTLPEHEPSLDHVIPRSVAGIKDSGLDAPDNCVAACLVCNYRKGSRMPSADEKARLAELNKGYSDEQADQHYFDMLRMPIHVMQAATRCGIKAS